MLPTVCHPFTVMTINRDVGLKISQCIKMQITKCRDGTLISQCIKMHITICRDGTLISQCIKIHVTIYRDGTLMPQCIKMNVKHYRDNYNMQQNVNYAEKADGTLLKIACCSFNRHAIN